MGGLKECLRTFGDLLHSICTQMHFFRNCLRWSLITSILFTLSCSGLFHHIDVYPPPTDLSHANHVVMVVIDGLRPDAITEIRTPTLHRLLRDSAYSLDAQTVVPSNTLPSHASMITGLPPDEHGLDWNQWRPEWGHLEIPSIFDLAREGGFSTAMFGGKIKLLHLMAPHTIDRVEVREQPDETVMRQALEFIRTNHPNLSLIHLPNVDGAGHVHGWLSSRQRQTIKETDKLLDDLIKTLEAFRQAGEPWVMIITSDHGGHDQIHGSDDPADTTIPWIVWGDSSVTGQIPRVSITSTATTAVRALGLQVPEAWLEHEQTSTAKPPTTQARFTR